MHSCIAMMMMMVEGVAGLVSNVIIVIYDRDIMGFVFGLSDGDIVRS